MKITLDKIDDGYGFEAAAGHHTVKLDASPDIGGRDAGFRPMYLMLVSLAGCSSMDIVHVLQKRHSVKYYHIDVEAKRREEHPRIFTDIELTLRIHTDAPDSVLDRVVHLTKTKYCSAYAILEATATIHFNVIRTDEEGREPVV